MLDEKNLKNSNDIIMTRVVFTVFFFIWHQVSESCFERCCEDGDLKEGDALPV